MKPLEHLRQLIIDEYKKKHPDIPEHAIPVNTFNHLKREKREKKRIEKFLRLMPNCTASIIENRGQRVDNTKTFTDVAGFVHKIGSVEWIGSGMRRGIEDISAVINGRMVAIELKLRYKNGGKDRQSKWQKQRQAEVEEAGGIYMIVSSFEDFYCKFFNMIAKDRIMKWMKFPENKPERCGKHLVITKDNRAYILIWNGNEWNKDVIVEYFVDIRKIDY